MKTDGISLQIHHCYFAPVSRLKKLLSVIHCYFLSKTAAMMVPFHVKQQNDESGSVIQIVLFVLVRLHTEETQMPLFE